MRKELTVKIIRDVEIGLKNGCIDLYKIKVPIHTMLCKIVGSVYNFIKDDLKKYLG